MMAMTAPKRRRPKPEKAGSAADCVSALEAPAADAERSPHRNGEDGARQTQLGDDARTVAHRWKETLSRRLGSARRATSMENYGGPAKDGEKHNVMTRLVPRSTSASGSSGSVASITVLPRPEP